MNYNRRLVNARCLFGLVWLLTLVFAAGAYAEGRYQSTEDRKKTLVWNNDPKPDDAATWSGARDAEGYAEGAGTLTWYRLDRGFTTGSNIATSQKKIPISRYSGTMAHGKFNGTVTTVDHGKAYHADFADGQRKGSWSAGLVLAKAETAEPAVKKGQPAESGASAPVATKAATANPEKVAEEGKATGGAGETTDTPAEGPDIEAEVSAQKPEVTQENTGTAAENTRPLLAQASTDEASATPRGPVTRQGALAPGAVRAIERPGSAPAKKPEPTRTKSEKASKPKPTASQIAEPATQTTEQTPAEGRPQEAQTEKTESAASKSQRSISENSTPSASETPTDGSLRSLVGPPSSLRSNPPKSDANPPAQINSPAAEAASPSVQDGPKLTAVEAMDIADIEARTRGYDLGEYQLPKAEYNATNETWSVSYAGQSDKSKKLSVTVQDKSGKAEVKK